MKIEEIMTKYGLTGTAAGFTAAVADWLRIQAEEKPATAREMALMAQIIGNVEVDRALALRTLRASGADGVGRLVRTVLQNATRKAAAQLRPKPARDLAEEARAEIKKRKNYGQSKRGML
ncbi:MAG: hypothetical protein U0350_05990 [Caldilineaceae bacterium]